MDVVNSALGFALVASCVGCGNSEELLVGKPLYSPDQRYMAVHSTASGGGAISPYCFDYVSVFPAYVGTAGADSKEFRVYEGACHSLGFATSSNELPTHVDAPQLKWINANEIEITFDRARASDGIKKFVFLSQADNGRIRIYEGYFPQ